jgi:hypothetical protein
VLCAEISNALRELNSKTSRDSGQSIRKTDQAINGGQIGQKERSAQETAANIGKNNNLSNLSDLSQVQTLARASPPNLRPYIRFISQ